MKLDGLFQTHIPFNPADDITSQTVAVPAAAGVVLLAGINDQPILLTYGANCRSIVRNRLADPPEDQLSKKTPLRPITTAIHYQPAYSPFQTEWAYFHLARQLYPDNWQQFFPHLNSYFLTCNPHETYPFLRRTDKPQAEHLCWGPFGQKKTADHWLDTITELFHLCRCPHLLAQAPHAAACPYAQMQQCIAVCDGSASRQEYRDAIEQAVTFLNSDTHQPWLNELHDQMKAHAVKQRFEQAQRCKTLIERIIKLASPPAQWVSPLTRFAVMTFQSGPKIKLPKQRSHEPSIIPFLITPGALYQLGPFLLNQTDQHLPALIELARQTAQQHFTEINTLHIAWTARFLYKKAEQALFFPCREMPDAETLTSLIHHTFAISAAAKDETDNHSDISNHDTSNTGINQQPHDAEH